MWVLLIRITEPSVTCNMIIIIYLILFFYKIDTAASLSLFFQLKQWKRNTNSSHSAALLSFYSVEWLSITAMCDIARNLRLKRRAFAEKNGKKEGKKDQRAKNNIPFAKKMFETRKKLLLLQKMQLLYIRMN